MQRTGTQQQPAAEYRKVRTANPVPTDVRISRAGHESIVLTECFQRPVVPSKRQMSGTNFSPDGTRAEENRRRATATVSHHPVLLDVDV